MSSDQPRGPERAAADTNKSQGARPDTTDHGDLEEEEVGNFEGDDQHGWAPDVDAEDTDTDHPK